MVAAPPGPGSLMPVDSKPAFAPLDRIHSSEIPPAEGMLALNVDISSGRGDEEGGATLSRRKTVIKKLETIEGEDHEVRAGVEGVEEEPWTYPDGGKKAWGVVAVRSLSSSILSDPDQASPQTPGCAVFASTSMAFGLVWGILHAQFVSLVLSSLI